MKGPRGPNGHYAVVKGPKGHFVVRCPKGHPGPFYPISIGGFDPNDGHPYAEDGDWIQCRYPGEKKDDGYCDERFVPPEHDCGC